MKIRPDFPNEVINNTTAKIITTPCKRIDKGSAIPGNKVDKIINGVCTHAKVDIQIQ
jgi:hypothetical protein